MSDRQNQVTLAQLLTLGLLPDHELIGGSEGLHRPLSGVLPGSSPRQVKDQPAGAVIVFEPTRLNAADVQTDVALRLGHLAGIAGLILERPDRDVPLATRRMADKFAVPLILLPKVDIAEVMSDLNTHVRCPEAAGARILDAVTRRLRTARDLEEAARVLGDVLRSPVALVDSSGRHVGGDTFASEAIGLGEYAALLSQARPASATLSVGAGERLILQPLALGADTPTNLWLVARLPAGSPLVEVSHSAFGIGSWAFASILAARSLGAERVGRARALLLVEVLERAERLPRQTVERATSAGWRLAGWHTAIQVWINHGAGHDRAPGLVSGINQALAHQGVSHSLVERPGGWVTWLTHDSEAGAQAVGGESLTRAVRRALLEEERSWPDLRLSAGIGRARRGPTGLKQSLAEADQACILAKAQDLPGAVEHIDGMTMTRLLAEWYQSGVLRQVAYDLLEPFRRADPSGDLVRTLGCYLDHESSATMASVVLGVHRNTILHRISRIRELLALDLDQPDQRLVAHLATRVARVDDSVSATPSPR